MSNHMNYSISNQTFAAHGQFRECFLMNLMFPFLCAKSILIIALYEDYILCSVKMEGLI